MRLGLLVLAITLLGARHGVNGSIDQLYCRVERVMIDAFEDIYAQKAVLSGSTFTVWLEFRLTGDALKRDPGMTLKDGWGVAYQLDDASVAAIHPLVPLSHASLALTLPDLKPGSHRLRVGLLPVIESTSPRTAMTS